MEAGLTNEREMRSYTATMSIAAESGCGSAVIVRQPFWNHLFYATLTGYTHLNLYSLLTTYSLSLIFP
jgi:hypothetical protein